MYVEHSLLLRITAFAHAEIIVGNNVVRHCLTYSLLAWKEEVEPTALMLHSMLEIVDFYKNKLAEV